MKDEALDDSKSAMPRRQIKCHHCSKVFNSIHVYHTHQRKKRKITCQECNKEVITFDDLKKHLATSHPESLEGLFKPLWENDEDVEAMKFPKSCYICDRVYNGHVMLNRHKELYHELGDFRCDECQAPCLTFYDFVIHNYQCHAKVISHIRPYTGGLEVLTHKNGKTEMKRENYSCQFCSSAFKFDTAHTSHMRRNHGFGLFECHSCDEMGHYAGAISAHMLNFHGDNPEVKCPGCFKVVNLKDHHDGFLEHYGSCKRAWTASKNSGTYEKGVFQCHYCGKEYASKVVFRAHIKQHEGIERFKCTYCDYGTNIKKVLEDHEKGHLRERGLTSEEAGMKLYYDCDQCDKKFVQESGLRSHKRRIHLGIKKSYLCKDCGEVYPNIQGYYKHKREKHGYVAKNVGRKGRRSHGPI
ncbi:hypothetical protein TCAL_07434 [Tigriopus californicus]|uniref:C2H2-type domain-containing protein n=1 Tax=Tigriopus californicus TaxID=6832 RepID=A0A553N7P8_TIGCA|nr:zinc finger protein 93-like [Tigriopus californicus]TRY61468.1 hypothetical protein TCAL_07434 [Tigriopus californicus]|eukprot:TCALIF_07434-PA protein Name:"Similar to ZNF564 Zinc finger protein 564 (Homo sapiens)" AED:0.43 eAED:0.43 QI:0/-1/0/1/-1/1/1/0/411